MSSLKYQLKNLLIYLSGSTLGSSKGLIPVITYHNIGKENTRISRAAETFREDMQFLKDQGFESISLERYLEIMQGGSRELPGGSSKTSGQDPGVGSSNAGRLRAQSDAGQKRYVAITFDDGYESVYKTARPILDEYGFNASVFVATAYAGSANSFEQLFAVENLPMMDEKMVRALYGIGWEILPHTDTHADLTKLDRASIEKELSDCEKTLREWGIEFPKILCYPFGHYNQEVIDTVSGIGYRAAFTIEFGFNDPYAFDPFRLKRIGSGWFTTELERETALNGRLDRFIRARKLVRKILIPGR